MKYFEKFNVETGKKNLKEGLTKKDSSMKKPSLKMRVGSEKYGTSVMKSDEVLLFLETCMESGADPQEAIQDMRMIDTLLYAERLHASVGKVAQKTKAGFHRKGSDLHTTFNKILEGRVNNEL